MRKSIILENCGEEDGEDWRGAHERVSECAPVHAQSRLCVVKATKVDLGAAFGGCGLGGEGSEVSVLLNLTNLLLMSKR